ncbi:hypothetical protein LWI28_024034 [Acer negundo]|uniref:Uncharacterized protein n=1 Tax=Acer negundo TaxID=4023 RepID=A0AAD5NY50_ACENE|nr:hypothetical protein LWI28_024034 [Acer negundo]
MAALQVTLGISTLLSYVLVLARRISYYKDGEYEGKPSDEVPYRGMTIRRHLGIDKELEGLRDVIVKDMKRLKEEVTKMKARTGAR